MSEINFCEEDAPIPEFIDEIILGEKLMKIASLYGCEIHSLTYIFCSDDFLLAINKEHLDHDYYTDIITFPYQQGKIIESDVFISVDRVLDNAHEMGIIAEDEFRRVIAHGLLHLIGFGDKSAEEEEKMRAAEEAAMMIMK